MRDFLRLLREGIKGKRKERGAKRQHDSYCLTFNCPHLITRSALASTFGGIARPICLAVFKLITSSNLFGCSTGRSAGLAPFRVLSTLKKGPRVPAGRGAAVGV